MLWLKGSLGGENLGTVQEYVCSFPQQRFVAGSMCQALFINSENWEWYQVEPGDGIGRTLFRWLLKLHSRHFLLLSVFSFLIAGFKILRLNMSYSFTLS